jgi:hypothetical protein
LNLDFGFGGKVLFLPSDERLTPDPSIHYVIVTVLMIGYGAALFPALSIDRQNIIDR